MDSLLSAIDNSNSEKTTREAFVDDFAKSFAHAAVQSPIDGLTQLASQVTGKDLPKITVAEPAAPAEFGSARWHMQQVGAGVGMAIPFLAINKSVGALSGRTLGAAEMTLSRRATNAAVSGFMYDSLLRPNTAEEMDNFALNRIKHGLTGAATFAGITATESVITRAQAARLGVQASELSIGRSMASHFVAGGSMGALNAQAESLLSGKGFASVEDTAKTAYQFGFVGASMGGMHQIEGALSGKQSARPSERLSRVEEAASRKTAAGDRVPGAKEMTALEVATGEVSRPAAKANEGILGPVREKLARVNNDAPESWLVSSDPVKYEAAREKAVDYMKKIYDGEPNSLHDLVQNAVAKGHLTAEQAKAYEYFMGDVVHGFEQRGASTPSEASTQVGNLQHTLREARSLLQDPAISKASPEDVFKALVSSAMSDARKPAGLMAVANHAYVAAAEIGNPLSRALDKAYGDKMSAADKANMVSDCSNIVLEHHLAGPRTVLGSWIHMPLIRQGIAADVAGKLAGAGVEKPELKALVDTLKGKDPVVNLSDSQPSGLQEHGMQNIAAEIDGLPTLLDKHLNGEKHAYVDHNNGPREIQLTEAEKQSMSRLGISGLYLTNPNARYARASQMTWVADQVQYVTGIERSIKYDAMYGPEFDTAKPFRAKVLGEGSNTAEGSYNQVRDRLPEDARQRLDAMRDATRTSLPLMRADFMVDWSNGKQLVRDAQGKLPYYDGDLKWVAKEQMKPLTVEENTELQQLQTAGEARGTEQQKRYDELLERKHYEQAVNMSNEWVRHLVKLGETKGQAPATPAAAVLPTLTLTGVR